MASYNSVPKLNDKTSSVLPNVPKEGGSTSPTSTTPYRLYKKRWLMLFIVCFLNISNSLMWINFSAVANLANAFYDDSSAADVLSLVYMIVAIPVGFIAMWSVDSFGLRTGIWLGTWVNAIGAAIRVISCIESVPLEARFPLAVTGQVIAAIAQPFIMYLPTKLAAQWFSENHRALANTFGSMSNPLGIMISMFMTPQIVNDRTQLQYQMLLMNGIMLAPAAMIVILVVLFVWSDRPPSPPSASAADVHLPFWPGFKMAVKNKSFLILVLCLGGGMGLFNAVYTLLEQILCSKGYYDSFSGVCGGLLIGGGLVGSVISGLVVDNTKMFEEVSKVCYSLAAVAICVFSIITLKPNLQAVVVIVCTLVGAFGFSIYPIGLELGVECTYPVAEATSAGLIIISGQLQGIVYVLLMSYTTGTASESDLQIQQCSSDSDAKVVDWRVPNLIFCGIASLLAITFLVLFWPKYKRMEAEMIQKKNVAELGNGNIPLKESTPTNHNLILSKINVVTTS